MCGEWPFFCPRFLSAVMVGNPGSLTNIETLGKIYWCTHGACGFTEYLAAAAVLLETCLVGDHVCSYTAGSGDCPSPIPSTLCRAKQPVSDSTDRDISEHMELPLGSTAVHRNPQYSFRTVLLLFTAGAAPVPQFVGKAPSCHEAPKAPRACQPSAMH